MMVETITLLKGHLARSQRLRCEWAIATYGSPMGKSARGGVNSELIQRCVTHLTCGLSGDRHSLL